MVGLGDIARPQAAGMVLIVDENHDLKILKGKKIKSSKLNYSDISFSDYTQKVIKM